MVLLLADMLLALLLLCDMLQALLLQLAHLMMALDLAGLLLALFHACGPATSTAASADPAAANRFSLHSSQMFFM
jgi:hypothetical protein